MKKRAKRQRRPSRPKMEESAELELADGHIGTCVLDGESQADNGGDGDMGADFNRRRLQEVIAKIRREAHSEGYDEGYQAALRDLGEIAGSPHAPAPIDDDSYKPRGSRRLAESSVLAILKDNAPRPVGPTEALHIAKKERGEEFSFTTYRRAFRSLEEQGVIEEVSGTKTWRLVSNGLRSVK